MCSGRRLHCRRARYPIRASGGIRRPGSTFAAASAAHKHSPLVRRGLCLEVTWRAQVMQHLWRELRLASHQPGAPSSQPLARPPRRRAGTAACFPSAWCMSLKTRSRLPSRMGEHSPRWRPTSARENGACKTLARFASSITTGAGSPRTTNHYPIWMPPPNLQTGKHFNIGLVCCQFIVRFV